MCFAMAKTLALKLHLLRILEAQHFTSVKLHASYFLPSLCFPSIVCSSSFFKHNLRSFCTARNPLFLVSGHVRPLQDLFSGSGQSLLHNLTSDVDRTFLICISSCTSSLQILTVLRSYPVLSGATAASVLHRLADLEHKGTCGLQNPEILSDVALSNLCQKLETDSAALEDEVVVKALLGCTRLCLKPQSQLVLKMLCESNKRLFSKRLSIIALCDLLMALFALKGQDYMVQQALIQLRSKGTSLWTSAELVAVYSTLVSCVLGNGGYSLELIKEMNARALQLAPRMKQTAVSKILKALVTLKQKDALPLVIALCKQAVRHAKTFTNTELTTVLSALMEYGHSDPFLVEALELHIPKIIFTADPETITRVMQYFSQRRIFSPCVFDAVAESFVYRAEEFSTWQVSQQMVALGVLGYLPPDAGRLFRKVESVLHARFSQFQPRALLELLHACTLLQRYPLNFVSKVFSQYFMQQLQDEGSGMDRMVLAQLTQLYMTVKLECPFYDGARLSQKFRVKSFLALGSSLETQVDPQFYNVVKSGLVVLLGARSYFASHILTPYCYTLDVEIKLDEEGYVLPSCHSDEVHKRIAVCIDGPKRFAANAEQLLGKEAIKQRHLRILGYEVVQIPFYEFEKLKNTNEVVEYLHKKIFPYSYRLSW